MKHTLLIKLFLLGYIHSALAQDTLKITLEQAEQRFVQKNFALLAQKFNISIAEAGVQQAKLWNNPNLFFETNLYNGYDHKFLPYEKQNDLVNPTGGVFNIQLQQVLSLTGSRSKLVKLAQTNVSLQQSAFQDVMRNARYMLSQTFGNLLNGQAKLVILNQERQRLQDLLEAFRAQLKLGIIAPYEVTRLELEQKNFERDLANLNVQIAQDMSVMRVLLSESGTAYVSVAATPPAAKPAVAIPQLLDLALENRPDIAAAKFQIQYNENNLIYQKSLAVPNLTLGADYQRVGAAFPHYVGVQALIDLPIRNRNQGNIQSAKAGIEQSKITSDLTRLQIEQDVVAASQQYQQAMIQQQKITPEYLESIDEISKNAAENYSKRVIDLVSFIDKIRAYRDAQLNLLDIGNDLFQSQQLINFVTNTKTF